MSTVSHRSHRGPATPVPGDAVRRCVDDVTAAAEGIFDSLGSMATAMRNAWNAERRFTAAEIAGLRPHIYEQLDRQPPFDSAGYVLAEAALADEPRHLEWWHRAPHNSYLPLILTLEPGAADCYDYYSMEWFVAALTARRRFASGPKIDLPCADVYIITFAYPVVVDGTVLGVSAADVALSRFESRLRPPLQRLRAPAVLVNRERRVITSNHPAWTSGEKLRELPAVGEPRWQIVEPVTHDLGWLLAVGLVDGS